MLLYLVCTVLGIWGVTSFFTGSIISAVIGGIAGVVENVIGIATKQQRSLFTLIFFIIVGIITSYTQGYPLWWGILFGCCLESAIFGILGILMLLPTMFFLFKKDKKDNEENDV